MTIQVIILLCFLILIIVLWVTNAAYNERLTKYMSLVTGFSTIIILFSFIVTLSQDNADRADKIRIQQEAQTKEFSDEVQQNWIDLEKMFLNGYPYLTPLYKELYPNNPNITVPTLSEADQTQANSQQQHMCMILTQIIEDVLVLHPDPNPQDNNFGWNVIFTSWIGSPTFQSNWQATRNFYNPNTQKFIDSVIAKLATT